MKEQIEWIGGYPHVVGVNDPKEKPLEEKIAEDIQWEQQAKAEGLKGWKLARAFIERLCAKP